ncbi:MAG: hypothetical protein JWO93_1966 [Micrococcaceae bacterium]|jgi:hypothetical protein|nr:hypothetical protein [Micrococcaceae bacterium]
MAQKVKIILVDDVDGGTADETVRFGLDGTSYEIDLSGGNAENLRSALQPYVAKARKVSGRSGAPAKNKPASGRSQDVGAIRAWARENGYEVRERGRIQAEIQEAYHSAHS